MSQNPNSIFLKPRQRVLITFAAAIEVTGLYGWVVGISTAWPLILMGVILVLISFPQDRQWIPHFLSMLHRATAPMPVTPKVIERKPVKAKLKVGPPAPVEDQQLKQAG